MSDRLWLGPTGRETADVNLIDCRDMKEAILEFVRMPGPHKVSGPIETIHECKALWEKLYRDGDIWIDTNRVGWDD